MNSVKRTNGLPTPTCRTRQNGTEKARTNEGREQNAAIGKKSPLPRSFAVRATWLSGHTQDEPSSLALQRIFRNLSISFLNIKNLSVLNHALIGDQRFDKSA